MKLFEFIAILFFDLLDKFFHQRRILGILKKKINEIDVFLDIGAHKGTYTDLVINNFKAKKVLMFEPQEDIFNYLKKKYKNKNNIFVINKALSDKSNILDFNFNKHDLTSSLSKLDLKNDYLRLKAKLFSTTSEGMIVKIKKIQTETLFSVLNDRNIQDVDFLKIDTEGHELQVLQGMKDKIKKVRCMLVEFHNDEIYVSYNPEELHKFLVSNNFQLVKRFKFPFTTWEDRFYMNLKQQ